MYHINDERVFADYADDQYIILNFVNGEYYSLDKISSAVLRALLEGCDDRDIAKALTEHFREEGIEEKVSSFREQLLSMGMIVKDEDSSKDASSFFEQVTEDKLTDLNVEVFTDVADLLLMDPIHEVDENMGWPIKKED